MMLYTMTMVKKNLQIIVRIAESLWQQGVRKEESAKANLQPQIENAQAIIDACKNI